MLNSGETAPGADQAESPHSARDGIAAAARSRPRTRAGPIARAFVFAATLLSDDASYRRTASSSSSPTRLGFRALMASEPLTAAGHEFDVSDAYRWRVSQDPFLLRNAWPEELEAGGHQPGPFLHRQPTASRRGARRRRRRRPGRAPPAHARAPSLVPAQDRAPARGSARAAAAAGRRRRRGGRRADRAPVGSPSSRSTRARGRRQVGAEGPVRRAAARRRRVARRLRARALREAARSARESPPDRLPPQVRARGPLRELRDAALQRARLLGPARADGLPDGSRATPRTRAHTRAAPRRRSRNLRSACPSLAAPSRRPTSRRRDGRDGARGAVRAAAPRVSASSCSTTARSTHHRAAERPASRRTSSQARSAPTSASSGLLRGGGVKGRRRRAAAARPRARGEGVDACARPPPV